MLDVSRIHGICFDVDGTLSDTDDVFVQKLNNWLAPVRFMFPKWDSLSIARRVIMATETPATFMHGLPDRLGIDRGLSLLGDYLYRTGLGRSPAAFSLIPGIFEMLGILSAHYPLGIVSARGEKSVQRFLTQFNINGFFKTVATAQTCKRSKPDASQIIWAAKQMEILPQQCLMVGDTTVDIIAGKLAGAQTVGVLCGFGEESELLNSGADLILVSTPELVHHVIRG
jgi:phosphoglycolate phosphatase-like HAD superfamily hydrolase